MIYDTFSVGLIFLTTALIFQAGWMIDFSLTKTVYVPFLFKTYQISGEVWFLIAYSYLVASGVTLSLLINDIYFLPFYIIYMSCVIYIQINRNEYKQERITLTTYGQRYNIAFYSGIVALVVGFFVAGVI
jgi:hypothetical protein